ncbi:hypothetical protein K1719_043007 [Acacia pycnantha]|nr:hypothetical protein K1719_043007 [Acacia pycnantha]
MPRSIQPIKGSKVGPISHQPIRDKDPFSKARGIKLSSRDRYQKWDPSLPRRTWGVGKSYEGACSWHPKISGAKVDSAYGFSRGIWILWSSKVHINILVNHFQFVHLEVSYANQDIKFLFTTVYGSPQKHLCRILWQDLDLLADSISSPSMERNTSYYHLKALMRRKRNYVSQLKLSDETWLKDGELLSSYARQFFVDLYSLEDPIVTPFPLRGAFSLLAYHQILSLEIGDH